MTGPACSAYSLRPVRAAEFGELQQIERAAAGLFPHGRVDPQATLSQTALAGHLRCRWLFCVTACGAGRIAPANDAPVGFIAATPKADMLHLEELSVHPSHGQRGLGARLLNFCVARARLHHFTAITLTTFADLPWNAPFYRRLGFDSCTEHALPAFLAAQLGAERRAGLSERIAMQLRL